MTTFNDLLRKARFGEKMTAEDTETGVRVVLKRGPLGMRVESYVDGQRSSEATARARQEGKP